MGVILEINGAMAEQRSYRLKEVAEILNVARETVLRMLHRGELRGYKAGRDWRITQQEIDRFQSQEAEIRHPKPADSLAEVNSAIAQEGECTRPSDQDQFDRNTGGRPSIPPKPED